MLFTINTIPAKHLITIIKILQKNINVKNTKKLPHCNQAISGGMDLLDNILVLFKSRKQKCPRGNEGKIRFAAESTVSRGTPQAAIINVLYTNNCYSLSQTTH